MYSNPSAEFYPRFQYALHTCVLQQCLIQASVEGMSIMHFSVSLIREAQCFQQFICSYAFPQQRRLARPSVRCGGGVVCACGLVFCWCFLLAVCSVFLFSVWVLSEMSRSRTAQLN
ncbi:unnamed protein product [Polarella glacialis]|uniref:Uncharacterized protein n=1 Tax=Polarella glacialis TaxID=89957 RepID=A0A813FZI0_POLGL|nr:unnamed protein product [Polarella glacialis]CAE8615992.1 unnamed protein product [Polarella glacialis]